MPPGVRAKAWIEPADDPLEREADAMADRVMRMAVPPVGMSGTASRDTVQRSFAECLTAARCATCEDEGRIARAMRENAESFSPASVDAAVTVTEQGGLPLERASRALFEPRFGYDFSQVRIHTDGEATAAAHAIGARAYAHRSHIVFGAGEYVPHTERGRRLLAHELAHVVQNRSADRIMRDAVDERDAVQVECPNPLWHSLATSLGESAAAADAGQPDSPRSPTETAPRIRPLAPVRRSTVAVADPLVEEANRAVDVVMGMAPPPLPAALTAGANRASRSPDWPRYRRADAVQRNGPQEPLHPRGENRAIAAVAGGGRPLGEGERAFFERRFGADFSRVRIHDDSAAADAALAIGAPAYAYGRHIAFARGQYAPGTSRGRHLLAHELAHTLQQSAATYDGARLPIARLAGHRVQLADWSRYTQHGEMPPCGGDPQVAVPNENVELGVVLPEARRNCVYSPIFYVPTVELPGSGHQIRIEVQARATVEGQPVGDWSVNRYECFDDGSSRAIGCASDRHREGVAYAYGSFQTNRTSTAAVSFPATGGSTRVIALRISNGATAPIAIRMRLAEPSAPEPTLEERLSEAVHAFLDLLGLLPGPFGIAFDGANAIIYAAEGEWVNAGISATAMIPIVGAGAVALRRSIRGGREVLELTLTRAHLRRLHSADVLAALRRQGPGAASRSTAPLRRVDLSGTWRRLSEADIGFLGRNRGDDLLSDADAIRELNLALDHGEQGAVTSRYYRDDYRLQIDLPNGHTWRLSVGGRWCRFTRRQCLTAAQSVAAAARAHQAGRLSEQIADVRERADFILRDEVVLASMIRRLMTEAGEGVAARRIDLDVLSADELYALGQLFPRLEPEQIARLTLRDLRRAAGRQGREFDLLTREHDSLVRQLDRLSYGWLRTISPSASARRAVYQRTVPLVDQVTRATPRSGEFDVDHIVPLREIYDMPGFSSLREPDMYAIANMTENLLLIDRAANRSRLDRGWLEWPDGPLHYPRDQLERMAEEAAVLRARIQAEIAHRAR
jgi:hypothetical protein